MAVVDKATLKSYFETGDKPTQAQFEDLIDSLITLAQLAADASGVEISGLVYPIADAAAGSVIKTDGAGTLSLEVIGEEAFVEVPILGGTATVDLSAGKFFRINTASGTTIDESFTIDYTNPPISTNRATYVIECTQDATGSRVITYTGSKFTKSNNVNEGLTQGKANAVDHFYWEWNGAKIDVGVKRDIVAI